MDCKKVCELLTAYLDGEVTPEEKAYIEAHLPGCPKCQAELKALSTMQTSLRSALKSMADEALPSSQAWEKVRARLETGETRPVFWTSLTLGRVTVAAAAVFIVVIAVVIWQYDGSFEAVSPQPSFTVPISTPSATWTTPTTTPTATPPPSTPHPSPIEPPARFIQMGASFDKEVYLPGEPVNMEISFSNITAEPYEISPFPPVVEVMKAGTIDDVVYGFSAGPAAETLQPGETVKRVLAWDQTDDRGQPVPWGQYYFLVPHGGTLEDSKILGGVFILPPEGVIEQTISLNQSKTAGGITFTLQKVELTASGPRFYTFNADFDEPERPPAFNTILGQYSLDGGPVREAGPVFVVGGGSELDGYDYVWFMSIPVPKGTKEITFVITSFGEWEGPWEFHIPLN